MASWTVMDICKEMHDVNNLLAVRMPFATINMAGYMAMAGAMTNSLCNKINSIEPLSASQAVELYKAVSTMQLCDELKAVLTKAIDDGVSCTASTTSATQALVPQSNTFMYNYMTQNDWSMLNASDCTYWTAVNVVATRLRLIGVKSLKEDTKKVCTAMLVHCFMQKSSKMPSYKVIYQLSLDLSQAHASCITQAPATLSSPAKYPEKPQLLGQDWMAIAYSPSDPPVEIQLENLSNLVQHHTPIRTTSKLLLDASSQSSQKASSAGDGSSIQQIVTCVAEMSKAFTTGLQNHLQLKIATPQQQCLPPLPEPVLPMALPPSPADKTLNTRLDLDLASVAQTFKPTPRLRLPLVQPPPALADAEGDGDQDQAAPATKKFKSLADYEQAAFDNLSKKKLIKASVMKRPASNSSAKPAAIAQPSKRSEVLLGCPRCRGSINGCSTCQNPCYNGLRLHGKAVWEAHVKSQKQKQHGKIK
jgi:hypothetical protein